MSIDMSKLNKPGLAGSFGSSSKTSGVSRQAKAGLSSNTSNNGYLIFNTSHKAGWVPANSTKGDPYHYNYQGIRARLNSGRQVGAGVYATGISNAKVNTNVKVDNGSAYQNGMVLGQVLSAGISMLNQLGVLGSKSQGMGNMTNSQMLDAAMAGGGSTVDTSSSLLSSQASSAISGMTGATNSADLTGAISSARGTLATMNAEASANKFEANYNTAVENKDSYGKAVIDAQGDVKQKTQDLSTAKNMVTATTTTRDAAKNEVSQADANYGKAVDTYTQAHDGYVDATNNHKTATNALNIASKASDDTLATLKATPEKIKVTNPDGSISEIDNPAYKTAKANYDNAKAEEQKAAEAENKAKTAEDNAKAAEAKAKTAKETAYKSLGTKKEAVVKAEDNLKAQQEKLDKAKDTRTTAEQSLQKSEADCRKAETTLETAKENVETFKTYKNDVAKLTSEIESQEKRLKDLKTSEANKGTKLDNKITDGNTKSKTLEGKIDLSNGADKSELSASKKLVKNNNKVAENQSEKDELNAIAQKRKIMEQVPNKTVDGQQYRTGTLTNGEQVYYRDTIAITAEEYKKAVSPVTT